jgi:hypothetical protein
MVIVRLSRFLQLFAILSIVALFAGCGGGGGGGSSNSSIRPQSVSVEPGTQKTFVAYMPGTDNEEVSWSVVESGGGSISTSGVYTAPSLEGTYHVKATSKSGSVNGTATVTVTNNPPEVTFPYGTWIGPGNISFTIDGYLGTRAAVPYYSGTIDCNEESFVVNSINVGGPYITYVPDTLIEISATNGKHISFLIGAVYLEGSLWWGSGTASYVTKDAKTYSYDDAIFERQ